MSGMGGGVIIKPALDATGALGVSTISFLSGCTVLSMTIVSLIRNRKSEAKLELKRSLSLGVGGAFGGVVGKYIFDIAKKLFANESMVGLTQSTVLLLLTIGVFFFVTYRKKIKTYEIQNTIASLIIGLFLGLTSAFLGIGGGPINLAILFFFFSMPPKTAANNSLFIIFLSQLASLLFTGFSGTIPPVDPVTLIVMIVGGIGGAFLGSHILKKLSQEQVDVFFRCVLILVMALNIYNIAKFAGL